MPTVNLGVAQETDTAQAITPLTFTPKLFMFPQQGQFNAGAIVGPRWQIHFFEVGTETARTVYASSDFVTKHTNPVVCDRFGNVPTIYVEDGVEYTISIRNERGVERHKIDSFVWPHTTRKLAIVGVAEETDTAISITPA